MSRPGIVLYGPPASGKDTITRELTQFDPRYMQFRRLKIGASNSHGYRSASMAQLDRLRAEDQVLYENERYGNTYVVDRPHLLEMLDAGQTPVIHLGQLAGVRAVTTVPAQWVTVLLWCTRETAANRALARGSTDMSARLAAWDETLDDLKNASASDLVLRLDTDTMPADRAAKTIDSWVTELRTRNFQGAQPP